METKLPKDFKEFLRLLNVNGVRYLLIGGYAVGFHGYPHATNDIDIFVARDAENARRLVKSLIDFGFETDEFSVKLFMQKKSIVRVGVEPLKIEIANLYQVSNLKKHFRIKLLL